MARATALAVLALLALSSAPAHASEPPLLLKPAIPPQLLALEAKADALQITSARVSVSTSLRLGHASKPARELARLLDFKAEGVETSSPPAAAVTVTLFGRQLRLRYVGGHTYLFLWGLGLHDGGRPWVELGHGGLGRLLGGVGKESTDTAASGAKRYAKLFTLVNDGVGIHELAPTTLYGQAVTGFEEEVERNAAAERNASSVGRLASAAASRPVPKPKLSIYFAASGAVVREQIHSGGAGTGFTVTSDFPAIDFPYTIVPPPSSHVIAEAKLLKRGSKHRGRRGQSKQ